MENTRKLYTTQEAAETANFSKQTVLNYVKDGVIVPAMQLPNGQCYFDEATVVRLMALSCAKDYKNKNTLAVCIGNEEECANFSEVYNGYLKSQGIQRVDDLAEYLMDCRKVPQSNKMHKRLCMIDSVGKTIRACEKEEEELLGELQKRLLINPNIKNTAVFIENKEKLADADSEMKEKLSADDYKIYVTELSWFSCKREKIKERYSVTDMSDLTKKLKNLPKDEMIEYEPKKPAVRSIWRKVEQTYLRDYTKDLMRQQLGNGYTTVLCLDVKKDRCIYELLKKAMNPCICKIEIYCMEEVTEEMQQAVDFLQDCKEVVFKSEI